MKTFLRFLLHNKLYTAIEAFGLALSLGFVLLLLSYAHTEFSVGINVPEYKEIYAAGDGDMIGMTLGTAPELFPSVPEIREWTRAETLGDEDIIVGQDYYKASILAVDQNFYEFMGYSLASGQAAMNKGEAVVSQSFAAKAFGSRDPIGQTIRYDGQDLRITGVARDFGPKDIFDPTDIFAHADLMKDKIAWMDNFGSTISFVKLQPGAQPANVASKLLDAYCGYWEYFSRDNSKGEFLWGSSLTRMDEIYFSHISHYTPLRVGSRSTVVLLGIVALVLLVSAVFNYINLSVAQTGKRAKEMAVRQLVGQSRAYIVRRYIFEALLFTVGCFLLGIVVALVLRPVFNQLLTTDIVLAPDLTTAAAGVALLAAVSLVSGLVPALFVMRIKPIDVVRGTFRFRSKLVFGKVFIVVQNVISTVLVAVAIAMGLQMHHLTTLPMGYNTDGLIFIRAYPLGYGPEKQSVLRQRLLSLPEVETVALVNNAPINCGLNGAYEDDGETLSWLRLTNVDSTAFRLLDFKVVEQWADATPGMVWVDRDTQRRYGLTREHNTIGFDKRGNKYNICGVIENYSSGTPIGAHQTDEHNAVQIIGDDYHYLSSQIVKVRGDRAAALAAVKQASREVAREMTGVPIEMDIEYISKDLDDSLTGSRNTMALVMAFMAVSILISALGLLAMSVYYTEQQSRQTALRRVFGYRTGSIVRWLTASFMRLSLVAVVIAMPLSVIIIRRYLEDFYFRISFPWEVLPLSVAITLAVTLASIIGQSLHAASQNPVETLKQND